MSNPQGVQATNPSNPTSWSTPSTFISSEPAVMTQNKGNCG